MNKGAGKHVQKLFHNVHIGNDKSRMTLSNSNTFLAKSSQMHFHYWKPLYFDSHFTEVCSLGHNSQYVRIGSSNGLAPNRHQAVTWQWWPSSKTHICSTRGRWVLTNKQYVYSSAQDKSRNDVKSDHSLSSCLLVCSIVLYEFVVKSKVSTERFAHDIY